MTVFDLIKKIDNYEPALFSTIIKRGRFRPETNYDLMCAVFIGYSKQTQNSNISIKAMEENGPIEVWDTSKITDMSYVFGTKHYPRIIFLLDDSYLNLDLSNWDTSNVTNMEGMFLGSNFNGNISNWDISNITNMKYMFSNSKFNNDSICKWNVSNVNKINCMFADSEFNQDISKWNIIPNYRWYATIIAHPFIKCPIKDEYVPEKLKDTGYFFNRRLQSLGRE